MGRLTTAGLMLLASAAWAQKTIYTWTDDAGVVTYSDDVSQVPAGKQVDTTMGDELGVLSTSGPKQKQAPPAPAAKAGPGQEAAKLAREMEWRRSFRELRAEIARIEDEMEVDRAVAEETAGLPVVASIHCAPFMGPPIYGLPGPVNGSMYLGNTACAVDQRRTRYEMNRKALGRAKDALVELERRAAQEAIPLEWRR